MSDEFAQVSGLLESSIDAQSLLNMFESHGIEATIDGGDLVIGGAGNLSVEFDKGINKIRSEGGLRHTVLEQVKSIVEVLSQNGLDFFIEVCDDDWNEIVIFGDYGHN